jgi:hypothetical protein
MTTHFFNENSRGSRAKSVSLQILLLTCIFLASSKAQSQTASIPQADDGSTLSKSFRCPEEFTTDDLKKAALKEFIRAYAAQYPNNNVRDLMIFRYRLLVAHSCVQTLKSMLKDIDPLGQMLRVENHDFGPKTQEFDPKTKVWTIFFRKDGEPPEFADQDLILNFYGWNPATSPEAIAKAFIQPREGLNILGDFEAPDDLTKAPAFFIVSETIYPGDKYGFVNLSKMSSVGNGAYAVTLTKKITGKSVAEIDEKGRAWVISADGKASFDAVSHVGIDPSWEQYLAQTPK